MVKTAFLPLLFLLFSSSALQAQDRLVLLDGSVLKGKVVRIENRRLSYVPANQSKEQRLSCNWISQIHYANGKTDSLQPILYSSEFPEWKKVRFSANPRDTEELAFKTVVEDHTPEILGFFSLNRSDKPIIRKIRKQAAKAKAHLVFLCEPPAAYPYQSWQNANLIYGRCYGMP